MKLSLVAAVAANGVIGADGTVPWEHPEDLRHFRRTTTGHPVIVGRRTFEAITEAVGGPLPDRDNIVLTRRPETITDRVTVVGSVDGAVDAAARTGARTAYVAGGGTVYEQFLPLADELLLTELDAAHAGDTTFPTVTWDDWTETAREQYDEFDIVRYARAENIRE
ncbi:dihydrofolate reductase [Haloarcula halophila]|uniref:dihydrofolate reductase n=1 Tax=Haloarcula TaxID=2237 RepID=UPI0023E46DA0|nr:dihydrofolate reductase [Halomicroarcula sp. DFY41]